MAPPAGTLRVGRYFLALLAILAVLYSIVFWPGARHTPKLGLDLVGGTQVIFTAKTETGSSPSKSAMSEAKQIMTDRVNGSGVTQSTVVIQGNNQLVVSIPGSTNTDVAALGKAAVLSLRGAVMAPQAVTCLPLNVTTGSSQTPTTSPTTSPTPSSSPSGSATPTSSATPPGSSGSPTASKHSARERKLDVPAAAPTPSKTPKKTPSKTPTPSASPTTTPVTTVSNCVANPLAALTFPIPNAETCPANAPTTCVGFDKLSTANQAALASALGKANCASATTQDDKAPYYWACDDGRTYGAQVAYLLGTVIVPGTQISSASAVAPNISSGQTAWTVSLGMKGGGQASWANYTSAHNLGGNGNSIPSALQCSRSATPCADYVGFTLDGVVISAPANVEAINGGSTQISGNFNSKSAKRLANQLKYGALPLSFTAQAAQKVSATLGSSQLKAGLLAGGIGLILVVIYTLIYYRALGLVTIASLVVSGLLTYAMLVILATQISFTLSLAGIAGFIVAIGITADSFVVFFERLKDEVHEGRSARVAVPRAWVRARRTILSADTVSFLAAAILYYFAAGDVRGFAFTLGLSTILDLVVVFLFTHPLVSLLSRLRSFGSARFTGLDALRVGGIVAEPPPVKRAKPARTPGAKPQESAVAVLEDEDDDAADEPVVADEPADEPEDSDDQATERRRTTPSAGTAAERAAARRAKLREEGDN